VLECFVDGFGVWTWSVSPEVGGVGLFFTVVILDLQKKRFIPLVCWRVDCRICLGFVYGVGLCLSEARGVGLFFTVVTLDLQKKCFIPLVFVGWVVLDRCVYPLFPWLWLRKGIDRW
jgi:hypothetical protein